MADVNKLHNFIKEISDQNGYKDGHIEIKAISLEGANYTSELFLVTVSAPLKSDLKLFAKVCIISEAMRGGNDSDNIMFELEHIFYTKVAVAFENLYKKYAVPEEERLYISKYYGYKATEKEETLVLENLVAKGFGDFDRMKSFNWDYASKAIEGMAKYHALGIAYRKENREEFERVCNKIPLKGAIYENTLKMFAEQSAIMTMRVVKKEHRDRMRKYLEKNNPIDVLDKFLKPVEEGFLVHGDYRPNNLMHRRRNGKIEVIPLDYQGFHLGNLVTDLMYFIWLGSDSHFRKYYYKHLIEHYYVELGKALRNLNIDIDEVYPRKTFELELEEAKPYGLIVGVPFMGVLTVEPENAPNLDTIENTMSNPNQLALERMSGIVEDYIQWGII